MADAHLSRKPKIRSQKPRVQEAKNKRLISLLLDSLLLCFYHKKVTKMTHEHHHISRRAGIIGFFTLISRVLGLLRDMALAYAFGATLVADAFYVAFRIPNLLRRLVAEGSLTVAFVPIYTEYLKKSRKQAYEVLSIVFTCLSILLAVIVILGILFAPWIVKLIAYGFETDPSKFDLTVYLTRIMFPYIFLISLVALAMGALNSLKRFAAPAASPILLNLAIIFGALFLKNFFYEPTAGVAIGVLIGGIAQLCLQMPYLKKEGMLPRFNFNWRHPALKNLGLMMLPSAYGAAIYQINVLVITLLASFLPHGSVSYLWYADRVSEFPLGIFAIAVATATLPTLSDNIADKDTAAFKNTANFGLRMAFLIDIPAAAGLFILSVPIVHILFERGEFTPHAAAATAGALQMFALGIPFVSGVRNLVPAFFALRSPKTPVAVATLALVSNAVLALILMKPLLHVGLALAMACSAIINFTILLYLFRRKIGTIGGKKLLFSVLRTLAATAGMAIFIFSAIHFGDLFEARGIYHQAIVLSGIIAVSVILYMVLIKLISPDEYESLISMIRKRREKPAISVPGANG
jgi:putative peptidoglycan lipid II flippase